MSKEHREKIRQAAIERHAARKAAEGASPPRVVKDENLMILPAKPVEVTVVAPPAVTPVAGPVTLQVHVPASTSAPTSIDPDTLFKSWLGSPVGRNASDPRMPSDMARLGIDLDDRLHKAFLAGFNAGRELA